MAKYKQNHGKPGVVYILRNAAFKQGLFKIGQSTKTGSVRAKQLNDDATTGTPAMYQCVFEHRTKDCGLAEELVHRELDAYRTGKWGQEFFEISIDEAKATIIRIVEKVDSGIVEPSVIPSKINPSTQFKQNYVRVTNTDSKNKIVPIILAMILGVAGIGIFIWFLELAESLSLSDRIVIFVLCVVIINIGNWSFKKLSNRSSYDKNQQEIPSRPFLNSISATAPPATLHNDSENLLQRTGKFAAAISEEAYIDSLSAIHTDYKYELIQKATLSEAENEAAQCKKWCQFLSKKKDKDELWKFTATNIIYTTSYPFARNYVENGIAIVADEKIRNIIVTKSYEYSDY